MNVALFDASAIFPRFHTTELSQRAALCFQTYTFATLDFAKIECASALRRAVGAKELEANHAQRVIALIEQLPSRHSASTFVPSALSLSLERDHSVYDCLYVACAIQEELPLVTADKRLARKFADAIPAGLIDLWSLSEHL